MNAEVEFPCPACGQTITAPEVFAGESTMCGTCGAAATVPRRYIPSVEPSVIRRRPRLRGRRLAFALVAGVALCALLVLLIQFRGLRWAAAVETVGAQPSPPPVSTPAEIIPPEPQPAVQLARIQSLFGIKLGEPLPAQCAIPGRQVDIAGLTTAEINPPEPNPAFQEYQVQIDPQKRVVCSIRATSRDYLDHNECDRTIGALLNVLEQRYGQWNSIPDRANPIFSWMQDQRSITFIRFKSESFEVSCRDSKLFDDVEKRKPAIPTRGF